MEAKNIKIFYLRRKIIFPNCSMPMVLNYSNITSTLKTGEKILTFPVRSIFDIIFYKNKLATLSEILDIKIINKSVKLNLKGQTRVKIKKISRLQYANYEPIDETVNQNNESILEELRKKSQELIFLINVEESDRLIDLLNYLIDLDQMTDFISNYFVIDFNNRYKLYNEINYLKRSKKLITILNNLIEEMKNKRTTAANE